MWLSMLNEIGLHVVRLFLCVVMKARDLCFECRLQMYVYIRNNRSRIAFAGV